MTHDVTTILIVALVVVFVIRRQLATRPVTVARSLLAPAAMLVYGIGMAIVQSGGHPFGGAGLGVVAALLAAELAAAVGFGVLRARTMLIWRAPDGPGTVLRRGNGYTLAAWAASVAARVGLGVADE